MVVRPLFVAIWLFFVPLLADAQSEPKKLTLRGYVKDLRILSFSDDSSGNSRSLQQNFIHNRLNLRYAPSQHWEGALELRNRFFYGEFLKYYPTTASYGSFLEPDPGMLDMNWSWIDNSNLVAHTAIDRMWVNWSNEKWDLRLGRQRVNWGQNLVWNPNDLFNVLNFADFDYEERPGMDGIRVQRYLSGSSAIEAVWQFNREPAERSAALRYRFNFKSYDIQLLGGRYRQNWSLGTGWAGNLKGSGLKGELTAFIPDNDSIKEQFLASVSWDYSFRKGTYVHTSFLYNSRGLGDVARLSQLSGSSGGQLDVQTLMPNSWSVFGQVSHSFHPLLSTSMAAIWAVDLGGIFIMPQIGYSLRQDLDLSLVGQGILINDHGFQNLGSALFLRLKWSF